MNKNIQSKNYFTQNQEIHVAEYMKMEPIYDKILLEAKNPRKKKKFLIKF